MVSGRGGFHAGTDGGNVLIPCLCDPNVFSFLTYFFKFIIIIKPFKNIVYNVVLVSAIQQSDSLYIHIYSFSSSCHYRK